MTVAEEHKRQIDVLRNRLSMLSKASLRINETLDLETVLQGVLDSARTLTNARYGVITLLDDSGYVEDYLSSGMTSDQTRELWELENGMEFFEYLSRIPGPVRLKDFHTHTRSLGLPEFKAPVPVSPSLAFMGTPVQHRAARVGCIYIGEKLEGREFTPEDEETLIMFASQAALVIANARQLRDQQRAKADLEILIDTSPVGVVVFDAKTGTIMSLNREARRIVGELLMPGGSVEELLDVVSLRRANGREVSLAAFNLASALRTGETVRAEEIVIQVPDGRSVTTLINATPIHSNEGEVESYVVTMQDMSPLAELDRLRTEFLGMVSHELRAPLMSIKGSTTTLLDTSNVFDPAEVRQFYRIIDDQADRMRDLISDLLDVTQIETGSLSVTPEPADLARIVDHAKNTYQCGSGTDNIEIDLPRDLPWVMVDRRRILQVLNNLLANAVRYSETSSAVKITAVSRDFFVEISVADEGAGVPAEHLEYIFRKFSRISGEGGERRTDDTGLGLAICKGIVEAHGGRVWAASDGPGRGTTVTFTLPVAEEAPSSPAPNAAATTEHSRETQCPADEILVIDDDPLSLKYVRETLTDAGYIPIVTADPANALSLITARSPQLVLLDLLLPGTDGIELMERILETSTVPVIFLSAYGRDETIARAFESGATDYVVKPFSPTELVARIRAALRRKAGHDRAEPDGTHVFGELTISYPDRSVTVAGSNVLLTPGEFQLLSELWASHGRTVTSDLLLQRIWGSKNSGDRRLLRSLVNRLRRKLGDDSGEPRFICTVRGVGYRLGTHQQAEQ